jgi:hypothetical protein
MMLLIADEYTSRPNALADILGKTHVSECADTLTRQIRDLYGLTNAWTALYLRFAVCAGEVIVEVESTDSAPGTKSQNAVTATGKHAADDDEDGHLEVFDEQGNVAAVIKENTGPKALPRESRTQTADANPHRVLSQEEEIRAAEMAFGVSREAAQLVAAESVNTSSAASQAVPDDFGIGYQRIKIPGNATQQPSYSIRTDTQAFPAERQLLGEAASNEHVVAALVHSIAQRSADNDDEFDYEMESHTIPSKNPAVYISSSIPPMRPESPVEPTQPEQPDDQTDLPFSALARVRAEIVAQQQAEHAASVKEMEARMLASSEVANGAASQSEAPNGLNALVEGEDEDEENEEEEAFISKPPATVSAVVHTPNAAPPENDEAAMLAAEFEMATASHQLRVQQQTATRGTKQSQGTETTAVTIDQLSRHLFRSSAVAPHQASVVVSAPDPALGCFGRLLAAKLAAPCHAERLAVFCAAKQVYEERDEIHRETFPTLFAGITGTRFVGARSSWTLVGFQRDADFSTDLRGAGMLGPLQALWLTQVHKPFVHKLYQLSQSEHQSFPFMIQSISITAKTLQALRLGRLDAVANRHFRRMGAASDGEGGPVLLAFNEYFAAFWFAFYAEWVGSGASIAQMGTVMNRVSESVDANVAGAISRFHDARSRPPFVDAAPQSGAKAAKITTQAALKSDIVFSASSNPMANRKSAYAAE